jgi:hypothetical protein
LGDFEDSSACSLGEGEVSTFVDQRLEDFSVVTLGAKMSSRVVSMGAFTLVHNSAAIHKSVHDSGAVFSRRASVLQGVVVVKLRVFLVDVGTLANELLDSCEEPKFDSLVKC